jgi:WD40 repeat protein
MLTINLKSRRLDGANSGDITSLAIDYERGKLICGLSHDGPMQVFDIISQDNVSESGDDFTLLHQSRLTVHIRAVCGLVVDPKSKMISASMDGTIKLWSTTALREFSSSSSSLLTAS